jgi:hypothetical protein
MMMSAEQSVECLAGKTEVLGENLPQSLFVHHKFHKLDLFLSLSCNDGKPVTNHLSYGMAKK